MPFSHADDSFGLQDGTYLAHCCLAAGCGPQSASPCSVTTSYVTGCLSNVNWACSRYLVYFVYTSDLNLFYAALYTIYNYLCPMTEENARQNY